MPSVARHSDVTYSVDGSVVMHRVVVRLAVSHTPTKSSSRISIRLSSRFVLGSLTGNLLITKRRDVRATTTSVRDFVVKVFTNMALHTTDVTRPLTHTPRLIALSFALS